MAAWEADRRRQAALELEALEAAAQEQEQALLAQQQVSSAAPDASTAGLV